MPAVSVAVGLIAAELGLGDEIVVPADEFTSVLFPLLLARERGAVVREVALERLPDEIGPRPRSWRRASSRCRPAAWPTSAPSSTGRPRSGHASWSMRPRRSRSSRSCPSSIGSTTSSPPATSTFCVRVASPSSPSGPDRLNDLPPIVANWRAADEPYGRYFGGPLTLAPDAVGSTFRSPGSRGSARSSRSGSSSRGRPTGAFAEARDLARELAERLGVEWGGASLVCAPIDDADAARSALAAAGVRAAVRGTAIRCATHVYTTRGDIERAARAIEPLLVV